MRERRLKSAGKSSPLPQDFLKMVGEVFGTNFAAGLKKVSETYPDSRFVATGDVYPSEVVLRVSLTHPGQLAATTLHASCDFDPKASAPTIEELLGACVDAMGAVFGQLLDPKNKTRIAQVLDSSLGALEDVPFEWTEFEIDKRKVHLKIDKSNPTLDEATDTWLAKNDPRTAEEIQAEQAETEALFVTGPSSRKKKDTVH